ncbi:unnamed protein product [Mytilus coruscus]|uniref:Integrase catalytic domain-containing protein n=1 Tax=Mytilus coruscus TaxID=42192 RepID=A0A6J8CBP0_MYTCO|nr:unnamed protein product [Mytilus coruscus]
MPVASQTFERVSTDILGLVSNSGKSKNQYVLVFICYLTKYVELIPLSDIKAATIATAFLHIVVCRHGTPLFLHSDRGVNYLSNIVKETCKLLDIKKTKTTSYNRPQCNGQSERMMSTIKDMLSKYIEDNSDWDRYKLFIQFAYNTSPSIDSTDYSPFFLVNGRQPKSFLDTHLPNMDVKVTAREYIIQTLENIEKARAVARENLQEHKTEMLKKSNRNRGNSNFSIGDIVYLYKPATTPNLRDGWRYDSQRMVTTMIFHWLHNLCKSTESNQDPVANLQNKTTYVVHHVNLLMYLARGLKLTKMHKVIMFNQIPQLQHYIEKKTKLRAESMATFKKEFNMMIKVFAKSMENIRNRVGIRNNKKALKLAIIPNFKNRTMSNDLLAVIHRTRSKLVFDKPIYLSYEILDLLKH